MNATARRTQQQRSAATQARLLDATIRTVVKLGYAGTSTTEICKAAGVSRGAQLHHYPTKAELVGAAVDRLFERRHLEFRKAMAQQLDPNRRLDAALDVLEKIYTGPTLHAWLELAVAARTDKQLRAQLARVEGKLFDEAQRTIGLVLGIPNLPEQIAAAATRLLFSTFDGLALHSAVEPGGDHFEITKMLLKELIRPWMTSLTP